jgi:hypothetical protein
MLENSTEEVRIRQGETITMPIELHYWSGLRTLLGIQFDESEAEQGVQGGLYNPPDGLTILLDADDAYFEVHDGRIVDVLTHRDVTLPEPEKIDQHMEGNMAVAKIGTITISVSDEVPVGDYYFGIKTTDSSVRAVYEGNSQLLAVKVIAESLSNATTSGYPYVKIDKLYVAKFGSEFENIRNNTILAGARYSVTAEISRLGTNFDTEGSLDYVLVLIIKDDEGQAIDTAWQSGTLPFGELASGGIYWAPEKPGSYTIDSLVLHSLGGTSLGEKQTIHVTVI